MKKFAFTLTVLLVVGFIYVGFGLSSSHETAKMDDGKMASELWASIHDDNYRRNWKYWPGKGNLYKGTEPHGALLTTYLNDTAYEAADKKAEELPYGSIVIKENYMPGNKIGAITVMKRVEGYNPEAGDWFWVKFAPNGEPLTTEMDGKTVTLAGKVKGCIGCHQASAGGIKFIMTPPGEK